MRRDTGFAARESSRQAFGARRHFLRIAAGLPLGMAAGWLANGCAPEISSTTPPERGGPPRPVPAGSGIVVPKVNGGMNIHPLRCLGCPATADTIDPALVALQLSAVYELGFDGIRVAAPLNDRYSFLATIAYVRAARALGIDALVLLADFGGFTLPRALRDDNRRDAVLQMYTDIFVPPPDPVVPGLGGGGPKGVGRIAFQILNEPVGSVGLPADVYVHEILTPSYVSLKGMSKSLIVVSAAEVGIKVGVPRLRAMLEAGLEASTDRIAYHVYSRDVLPMLPAHVREIVWITESNSPDGTATQLPWVRDVFPEILSYVPDATRIFFYDLFDTTAGVFRILDIVPAGDGFSAVVESTALHDYWSGNVLAAAAGSSLTDFATLVPDIRQYFPTAADVSALDSVLNA